MKITPIKNNQYQNINFKQRQKNKEKNNVT